MFIKVKDVSTIISDDNSDAKKKMLQTEDELSARCKVIEILQRD